MVGVEALGGIGYFLLCTGSESPELLVISRFYITRQRYSVYWWGYMLRLHTGVGQKRSSPLQMDKKGNLDILLTVDSRASASYGAFCLVKI